jgi:hypothetical protein
MGARNKLNQFYVYSCVGSATLVGLLTGSWAIFGVALALALAGSMHFGVIRVRPDQKRGGPRRRPRR